MSGARKFSREENLLKRFATRTQQPTSGDNRIARRIESDLACREPFHGAGSKKQSRKMSKNTKIQWCDSTANPIMGCHGCELWPSTQQLAHAIAQAASDFPDPPKAADILQIIGGRLPTDVYHLRRTLAEVLVSGGEEPGPKRQVKALETAIASAFRCYAGILHLRHGKDDCAPKKRTSSGYAEKFEKPKLFPGRMAEAAAWSDLESSVRPDKPWINGLPRLIFISDMGDAFTSGIPFDFLKTEVIDHVNSLRGKRHIWLWLTKRPGRMAEFSDWLVKHGSYWPNHVIAMTTVTSQKTVHRIDQLCKVQCAYRGISVEPLWSSVKLPLDGIEWVIVGGESGSYAKPFDIDWARDIVQQCRSATVRVAPFVKQLGSRPISNNQKITLKDRHGGDWSEWPEDLRIREFPLFPPR